MRTSSILTVSLSPQLAATARKAAKKKQMTTSELMRAALRFHFEQTHLDEVVRASERDLRAGKAEILPPGGLEKLMQS